MATPQDALAPERQDVLRRLNNVLMLEHALVDAYGEAVDRLEDDRWATRAGEVRMDHAEHAREIAALIRALGGEPKERASMVGPTRRGVVGAAMGGDRGVLLAMRATEARLRRVYDTLATARNVPPEVAELARRVAERERAHDHSLAS